MKELHLKVLHAFKSNSAWPEHGTEEGKGQHFKGAVSLYCQGVF